MPQERPAQNIPLNVQRNKVPALLDVTAAWMWRLLLIIAGFYVLALAVAHLKIIFLPVAGALLLTALVRPLAVKLRKIGLGRFFSALLVVLLLIGAAVSFATLTGAQLAEQFSALQSKLSTGLTEVKGYLTDGPFHFDQTQIDYGYKEIQDRIGENQGQLMSGAVTGMTAVGEILAGTILSLFVTFFFLYDGDRIWNWIFTRFPKEMQTRVNGAGVTAWTTVTSYVRGTTLVAFVNSVGIGIALALTGVPLVLPLALLTFAGGFIPIAGALLAGSAAVLVALVSEGPVAALIVLLAVLMVQQLESHILQPLVLSKAVQLHPLVIVLSLTAGAVVAGIPGAIVAVPFVAVLNNVAIYLANPDKVQTLPAKNIAIETANKVSMPMNKNGSPKTLPVKPGPRKKRRR